MDTFECAGDLFGMRRLGKERTNGVKGGMRGKRPKAFVLLLQTRRKYREVGIFSLRHRRLRSDMNEVFKMIHGTDKVNLGKLFG